jgi:hypothetical protein
VVTASSPKAVAAINSNEAIRWSSSFVLGWLQGRVSDERGVSAHRRLSTMAASAGEGKVAQWYFSIVSKDKRAHDVLQFRWD